MTINAERRRATPLENEPVRADFGLWRLYLEIGRRRGDFLIDRRTESGRVEPKWDSDFAPETCHSSVLRHTIFERAVKDGLWPGAGFPGSRQS